MAENLSIRRGDIVIAAAPGDFGKPRPCLVVQSDFFHTLHTVTVCLLSSDLQKDMSRLRLTVQPSPENGLRVDSQVAIDKIISLATNRIGARVGRLDDETMTNVERMLSIFLGLGEK